MAATTYSYRVQARQMGVISPWSNVEDSLQTAAVGTDIEACAMETGGYLSLHWTAIPGATHTVEWTSNLVDGTWGPFADGTSWPISATGWTSGIPIIDEAFFFKVTSEAP